MNLNIVLKQWFKGVCCLFILLSALSCSDSYEGDKRIANENAALVTLDLLVPGVETTESITRAMDVSQEKAIKNLQVLVFENTATAEVYRNVGEVTSSSNTQLTVKMPLDKAEYRFVILANAPKLSIADGVAKEEALNEFTFACSSTWATNGDRSYIPMWGETRNIVTVDANKSISVSLFRALARVDVGLNFKAQTQGNQTEEVDGLSNFKISSIRVYRTMNKAYVATSTDKMNVNKDDVISSYIPDDAEFNLSNGTSTTDRSVADAYPLLYKLNSPANKYIREIYIPESVMLPSSSSFVSMDDVPCLVIGGHYKGGEETFYRADFASYTKDGVISKVDSYKEVLRNHRHVFNIKAVNSPGFKEPEQALHSIVTPMELNVSVWNEVPLNMFVQGNKFFQIKDREVVLNANYPVYNNSIYPLIGVAIPFTTNIKFVESGAIPGYPGFFKYKNLTFKWNSTGTDYHSRFQALVYLKDVQHSGGPLIPANSLVIQTNKENIGGGGTSAGEISDVLHVTVDNMEFSIKVTQKAANVEYSLMCEETVVNGKYREGVELNYSNYLEVKISSSKDLYTNQTHLNIYSEKRKGIQFAFDGKLDKQGVYQNNKYVYTIKLQGSGTPVKDPYDPNNPDKLDGILTRIDKLIINSNSVNNSSCANTTILFGYKTKRILAIGANAIYRFGYMLEPNTGSRAFVDASINFGIDPKSAVTMEQFPSNYRHPGNYPNKTDSYAANNAFHIEYMTAGRGMAGERIKEDYLNQMLSGFKPDIILTGQAIDFTDGAISAISNFVDKGGVFLMFNEYYPSEESINKMAGAILGSTLTGKNEAIAMHEFAFRLPTGNQYKDDMILNGMFGDLRGASWGTDGYFVHGFGGIPMNDVVVYNTRKHDGKPCFFRYQKKPFVFVGDGGFISNDKRYIGPTYVGMIDYCPFAINSAYQPIDRTNYTPSKFTVSNSKLFGNILTWAVDYAEQYGINR